MHVALGGAFPLILMILVILPFYHSSKLPQAVLWETGMVYLTFVDLAVANT